MEQDKVKICEKQARIFARAIYKNVSAYIQAHQEEYREFLRQEEMNSVSEDQSPY